MPEWEDYYKILQVHPSAEHEVIDAAFRRLAKKYHPDVDPSPQATEKMKKINTAHDVLSDSVKRQDYHQEWLRRQRKPPPTPPPPTSTPANIVLSDFSVSPQHIQLGRSVTVSVIATNNGGTAGSITIPMVGDFIGSQAVTLNPAASTVVKFTLTPKVIGIFNLSVAHFSGSFSVTAPPSPQPQPVPPSPKTTKRIPVMTKWLGGLLAISIVIGLATQFWPMNTPTTAPTPEHTSTPTSAPNLTPTSVIIPSPTSTQVLATTYMPSPTTKPTSIPMVSLTPIATATPPISVGGGGAGGGGGGAPLLTPTYSPTPSPSPSPTPTPIPTPTPSPSPSPTPTPISTPTPSPSPSPTPTQTPIPSPTTVFTYSDSGMLNTPPFDIATSPWKLQFSTSWSGHFAVQLMDAGILVINQAVSAGVTYETYVYGHTGSNLYFSIISATSDGVWTLSIPIL